MKATQLVGVARYLPDDRALGSLHTAAGGCRGPVGLPLGLRSDSKWPQHN